MLALWPPHAARIEHAAAAAAIREYFSTKNLHECIS
jgi:hypothetical protein